MDDRELLELAAKAYEITGIKSKHGHWVITDQNGARIECCYGWPKFCQSTGKALDSSFYDALVEINWNPLEDDGDAFRLAIKLELCFDGGLISVYRTARNVNDAIYEVGTKYTDPYKVARRLIVQAAAQIGRRMK